MIDRHLRCLCYRSADGLAEADNPYRNLAVEEFLVQYAAAHVQEDTAILYLWQNADCVVFGRNQNPSNECRLERMEELGVLPVRRKTGGGAVFHDLQNLNFSFIVPKKYYDREISMQIVVRALQSCGIDAAVNGRNDILAGDCKVSGNAYLSKNGVCLHHGTLLIATDTDKMDRLLTVDAEKFAGKGVRSVRSRVKNLNELMPMLTAKDYSRAIADSFLECYAGSRKADFTNIILNDEDMECIRRMQQEYASKEWIFGHETQSLWQRKSRFDWGSCMVVYTGASYEIYSDTLYTEAFEQVKQMVCRHLTSVGITEAYCARIVSELPDYLQKKIFQDICSLMKED